MVCVIETVPYEEMSSDIDWVFKNTHPNFTNSFFFLIFNEATKGGHLSVWDHTSLSFSQSSEAVKVLAQCLEVMEIRMGRVFDSTLPNWLGFVFWVLWIPEWETFYLCF